MSELKVMDRTTNTYRNLFWGMGYKIVGMVCPFIFRAIIIRELGGGYIGLNGLFTSVLKVLNMSELGFGSAVIYMMYKPVAEGNKEDLRSLLNMIKKIYQYVGLSILIAGSLVYPLLPVLVKNDTGVDINIYVLYTMYLFNSAFSYLSSAYRSTLFTAWQRNDILSKILLATEIVKYSLQAIVLYVTKNYYLYVLVFSLSVILENVLYYLVSRRVFPDIYCEGEISAGQKKEIKNKVIPLLGHRIGGTVIISIDELVISAILGIYALTKYDNYYAVFSSVNTMLTVFRSSVVASLGNKLYSSTKESLFETYKKVYFLWVMLVGWCACLLAGLYQPFVKLWVGPEYVYSDKIMLWISAYFFVWQFRFIGVTMKEAAGLWEPDRWKPIIGMTLNFFFSVLLVKLTGSVLGVLWPTMAIMAFLYFPWETHVLFTKIFNHGLKEYLLMTVKCFGSVLLAGTIVYLVTDRIPMDGIRYFILRLVLCLVIPFTVFTAFHGRSVQYRGTIRDMKTIIRKIRT